MQINTRTSNTTVHLTHDIIRPRRTISIDAHTHAFNSRNETHNRRQRVQHQHLNNTHALPLPLICARQDARCITSNDPWREGGATLAERQAPRGPPPPGNPTYRCQRGREGRGLTPGRRGALYGQFPYTKISPPLPMPSSRSYV